MEEKLAGRFLRKEFRVIGWLLVAYYVLMNLMVMVSVFADALIGTLRSLAQGRLNLEPNLQAIQNNAWGYIAALAVGMLVLFVWKNRRFWGEQVFARKRSMTPGVFLAALCLCAGPQLVNSLWVTSLEWVLNQFGHSVMDVLESVSGTNDSVSMFLYAAILAPITEEILFRGWIQESLRPYGKKFAILGSAILFGLFHGNLLQTPYAFLVGLVLGWVALEYSIYWAIGLHMFNNLVLADLMTRLLELLPQTAGELVNLVVLGGFTLAAVGILIAKRREIRDYIRSEWMDRQCLKWFFLNSGFIALLILMVINGAMVLFI